MKLFELTGIKNYKNMTGKLIMKVLERKGILKRILGKGHYGMAFELHNGEVLKVWHDDPAYEKYIDYCVKIGHPNCVEVFGKISDFQMKKPLTNQTVDMKFVRIEQLEPIKSIKEFGYNGEDTSQFQLRFFNALSLSSSYMKYRQEEWKAWFKRTVPIKEDLSSDRFEDFLDVSYEIGRDLVSMKLDLDLHINNYGLRGKTIVFLDPVVDGQSTREPTPINKVLE